MMNALTARPIALIQPKRLMHVSQLSSVSPRSC